MAIVSYRRNEIPPPTEEEIAEIRALAERPDSEIDLSDMPELTDEQLAQMLPWDEAIAQWRKQRQTTTVS